MNLRNNLNTRKLWYIRATKENISTLRKWLVSEGKDYEKLDIGDVCSSYRYKGCLTGRRYHTKGVVRNFNYDLYISNDYNFGQEITFEDFKENILKEDLKPIFKTNSGGFLYKKDSFYIVSPNDKGILFVSKKLNVVDFKYKDFPNDYNLFKTKKQAEDYCFENKLSLSLKDLLNIKEIKENRKLIGKIKRVITAKKDGGKEEPYDLVLNFSDGVTMKIDKPKVYKTTFPTTEKGFFKPEENK
jgi:hypothetical protein